MTTIVVTNTNDSGSGSLREAVEFSNNSNDQVDVVFDPSLNESTINLEDELVITGQISVLGDTDEDGDRDITISGLIRVITGGSASFDLVNISDIRTLFTLNAINNYGEMRITNSLISNIGTFFVSEAPITNYGDLEISNTLIEDVRTAPSGPEGVYRLNAAVAISNSGDLSIDNVGVNGAATATGDRIQPPFASGFGLSPVDGIDGGDAALAIIVVGEATIAPGGSLALGEVEANPGRGGPGLVGGAPGANGLFLGVVGEPGVGQRDFGLTIGISGRSSDDQLGSSSEIEGQLILGFDGDDTITGGFGADEIRGGEGADQIVAGAGGDTLFGEVGDDWIDGQAGDDVIDGAFGADTLMGDAGADEIQGGDGNDFVFGGYGDDTLGGDQGDDQIVGGQGDDHLNGAKGGDTLLGEAGQDSIFGGGGDDRLFGGADADNLVGDLGRDRLAGGQGQDVLNGAGGSDTLLGGGGADVLSGGRRNDILLGGGGRDDLSGGTGRDRLVGGNGRDTLEGSRGQDTLIGGGGSDVFAFKQGDGRDLITDFDIRRDAISISGVEDFSQLALSQQGGNTRIQALNIEIILRGVDADNLGMDSFIF